MPNFFSPGEIVQLGVAIEKNGKDFYSAVAAASESAQAREIFKFLSLEEEKHIIVFTSILSTVEKYEPPEAYTEEYFAYLRALAESHVFTKKDEGKKIAAKVKSDKEAIDLALGFERDSILFYYEMKKLVLQDSHKAIDRLIAQEQEHLLKLSEIKKKL
ncbi:MAG: hypothetical protein A2252_09735 [Elusimicrobia bacterium RIFOXYA2_FULL_39_19]|nr:MAG: hypothetical protein A2252_09735 [Elusimicrobia bacterium RIFOXYA2_FULL_39_19]